jgi:anti-anti-sigma factor
MDSETLCSAFQEWVMKISQRYEKDVTIFALEGRVDSEGAMQLDETLRAAVEAGETKIVLDMSEVQYMNSAALRTLADIITKTRDKDGDMKLAALQPKVRRVLQIVGFDRFSSVHETLESALAAFA